MNNSFYDNSGLNDIDQSLDDLVRGTTLVDGLQKKSEQVQQTKRSLGNEIKRFWYIYIPLAVSSIFTAMLGIYMGLAPYLKTELNGSKNINFNTDWGHSLTAAVYVAAFLYVTEIGFAIFLHLFHKREEGNTAQTVTMVIGMILSAISIIGTGYAGGTVVASTLGFLSEFKEIPASAQQWVVKIIPVFLGLHAILFGWYKLSSRHAQAERIANEAEAKLQLDNQTRMRLIELQGQRQMQAAAIRAYTRLVESGVMTVEEAEWAKKSGKSLAEIERLLKRDLTGEGRIGDVSGLQIPATPPHQITADNSAGKYEPWICLQCGNPNGDNTSRFCGKCGTERYPVPVFSDNGKNRPDPTSRPR